MGENLAHYIRRETPEFITFHLAKPFWENTKLQERSAKRLQCVGVNQPRQIATSLGPTPRPPSTKREAGAGAT